MKEAKKIIAIFIIILVLNLYYSVFAANIIRNQNLIFCFLKLFIINITLFFLLARAFKIKKLKKESGGIDWEAVILIIVSFWVLCYVLAFASTLLTFPIL